MVVPRRRSPIILIACLPIATAAAGAGLAVLAVVLELFAAPSPCVTPATPEQIVLGPPGTSQLVGATEYGGPGDPSSGTVGSSGMSLLAYPDSYAELGGHTFQTATAMGGLPYMTPLRITWGGSSAIPYEHGLWSGPVEIERPPPAGAGNLLGQASDAEPTLTPAPVTAVDPAACVPEPSTGVPLTSGDRARLLPNGLAAAPADAPAAVKEMIAAGNQIVGKPYLYGGGHGLPLSDIAPAYDCSSSVEHLLYGAGLLPVTFDAPSSALESFGQPGPGAWVTVYANADHVFMYVAGLRWDTHNAAGPGDGSAGIGWHPLVRSSDGFVARHPEGL
jgi:hypothetical protein